MGNVAPNGKSRKKRSSTHRSRSRFVARILPGAKASPMPGFILPCIPVLKSRVPSGERWVHEIKHDGYRVQGHIVEGVPKLFTRRGHDWTHRMGGIAEELSRLPANNLVVDGEVIVPDQDGRGDFSALEAVLGSGRQSHSMLFYLFDILHLDGFDLRASPLLDRKRVLAELLEDAQPPIRYLDHMDTDGGVMFDHACRLRLEGVVSKLRDAPYWSGRNGSWVKVKCYVREVFTIVGFEPEGKHRIAALHLAKKSGRRGKPIWTYVGKVGTGFSDTVSTMLRKELDALIMEGRAVTEIERRRATVAVVPLLSAKIDYRSLTSEGRLRHSAFKGLQR